MSAGAPPPSALAHYEERTARFRAEIARLPARREGAARVVLLGDSITEELSAHVALPGVELLNRGIASDHLDLDGVHGMLHRVDAALLAPDPTHVVVLGGVNDLADAPSAPERVVERSRALLDRLAAAHPRASVVLVSLSPTRGPHAHLAEPIVAVNRGLRALAESRGLGWIDLHGLLRDDGDPRPLLAPGCSRDGLHLTGFAYRRWRDAIAAAVGERPPRLVRDAAREATELVRREVVRRAAHALDRGLGRGLFARALDAERDRTALLFFEDVERDTWLRGDRYARRSARRLRHALSHRQRATGFGVAFEALRRALSRAGWRVVVNDHALARANPHHPVCVAGYPHVLERWTLPNPAILGPGLFDHPGQAPRLFDDPRFRAYLVPDGWMAELFRRTYGAACRPWHAGIDLEAWPSFRSAPKDIDVLVYAKFLWDRARGTREILEPLLDALRSRGLRAHVLRYGAYEHGEYRALLRRSRSMALLVEHETQGIACHEAMACDVPILAWDQGRWLDPIRFRYGDHAAPASSVPYFEPRCGERFATAGEIDGAVDRLWSRIEAYEPRAFVAERLSLDASARLWEAAFHAVARRGR